MLYKQRPARISQVESKKIEIETDNGRIRVRPKDVVLLHKGPLVSLSALQSRRGEVMTAWELLAGETTTLSELSELAFAEFTPQTAWSVWEYVEDGLYFSGTPDEIAVHTAVAVAAEKEARAAKAAEEAAWDAFLERVAQGALLPEDGRFLQDVVGVAMKQQSQSRTLKALHKKETPEQAHALLLELGYWDHTVNPYPARSNLPTKDPELTLPALPDEDRRDLTHLLALAIDDEGSQDPDDAVSWEDGRLWVHVADVAALITPDSPADIEARARGANLYLPEGTVHMLPPAATDVLALGLQPTSPALSFGMDLNEAGQVEHLEIVPSWVQVTRLSYAEANERLHEAPFAQLLAIAKQAAARRRANGSVEINLPEVRVRVGEDGTVMIRPLPNLDSRILVQEAMLIAGEAVARFALINQIPVPFTVQDAPDLEGHDEATTPSENFALRRKMQASQPSSMPGSHAGLGLGIYVQVTSPLRRYLDLVIHQQLRAYLRGEALLDEQEVMARVGAANAVSGEVRWAERQANKHWTLVYLQQQTDWQDTGVIVEQRRRRSLVLVPALAWDSWVHLSGQVELDTAVSLTVSEIDLPLLEAKFRGEIIQSNNEQESQ